MADLAAKKHKKEKNTIIVSQHTHALFFNFFLQMAAFKKEKIGYRNKRNNETKKKKKKNELNNARGRTRRKKKKTKQNKNKKKMDWQLCCLFKFDSFVLVLYDCFDSSLKTCYLRKGGTLIRYEKIYLGRILQVFAQKNKNTVTMKQEALNIAWGGGGGKLSPTQSNYFSCTIIIKKTKPFLPTDTTVKKKHDNSMCRC